MKPISFHHIAVLTLVLAAFSLLAAQAQQNSGDTLVFGNGGGGNGTWENGAGTTWDDVNIAQDVNWNNSVPTFAIFNNTPGNVTVTGPVNVNNMEFDSSFTLTGGTITKNGDASDSTIATVNNNSNVTINDNIIVTTTQPTDQYDINNNGSGTVTYNGNITYSGTGAPSRSVLIDNAAANSTTILNGTFSTGSSDRTSQIWIRGDDSATLELNGNYNGIAGGQFLSVQNGTAILGTSQTGTGVIQLGGNIVNVKLLTSGAQNIANEVDVQNLDTGSGIDGTTTIGGTAAAISNYTGVINGIVSGIDVTAAAGGRVNFTNSFINNLTTGLTKIGDGTVTLGAANTYGLAIFTGGSGTVAGDIQQGTLLINSASGFGTNSGEVKVEAGATLGGNGSTGGSQKVMALSTALSNAVIAPGDAGQHNLGIAASMGTLNLAGGLEADNGLTMDFKLNGAGQNDLLTVDGLTLGGHIVINLTALGSAPLLTDTPYQLIDGSGDWTHNPDFTVNAPTGYTATYSYQYFNNSLTVELEATPEPSTYAMMLGGLALLGFCIRRKVALLR